MKKTFSYLLVCVLLIVLLPSLLKAQGKSARDTYVDTYKYIAVKKMLEHGIPASITLAQGILESGAGKSGLARQANNHFGIKCHKGWQGGTYIMDDDEKDECFRKYSNAEASYEDHSQFLLTRSRYAFLFKYKRTEYKKWARGLKKAGYATNPRYADLLIKVIEDEGLHQYDKVKRLSDMPKPSATAVVVAANSVPPTVSSTPKPQSTSVADKQLTVVAVSAHKRMVYKNNGVKLIKALHGDTYATIAKEFNVYTWQLRKYNLADKKHKLQAGEWVYLQKKRNKAKVKYHTVQQGESLRDISQKYALKMRKLMKRNKIKSEKQTLKAGRKLRLR